MDHECLTVIFPCVEVLNSKVVVAPRCRGSIGSSFAEVAAEQIHKLVELAARLEVLGVDVCRIAFACNFPQRELFATKSLPPTPIAADESVQAFNGSSNPGSLYKACMPRPTPTPRATP